MHGGMQIKNSVKIQLALAYWLLHAQARVVLSSQHRTTYSIASQAARSLHFVCVCNRGKGKYTHVCGEVRIQQAPNTRPTTWLHA